MVKKIILISLIFFSVLLYSQENSPLFFGNPSGAVCNSENPENYLMEKSQFTLSYNNTALGPNWVAWHLSSADIGEAGRSNKFKADSELPDTWYKVTQADYKFTMYGFDRGHLCPSADRTATAEDNQITFLMTNMLPQSPDLNRIVWVSLENFERELALAGNELYIFAGGAGKGGEGQRGSFTEIPVGNEKINVPAFCWKIILVLPEGEDDFSRISPETQVISVIMPNVQGLQTKGNWKSYVCSVDDIEALTGYDFFDLLEDSLEQILEEKVYQ